MVIPLVPKRIPGCLPPKKPRAETSMRLVLSMLKVVAVRSTLKIAAAVETSGNTALLPVNR